MAVMKKINLNRIPTRNRLAGSISNTTFHNAALMIINAQNEYFDGALAIPGILSAVNEISLLLDRARNHGAPIIYIQHIDRPGGIFDLHGRGGRFIEAIAPDNDEYILQKTMPNGFAATNLNDQLEQIGRKKLIIAGFMTHMCVSFTARAAAQLGYQPSVVARACAAAALPVAGGENTVIAGDDRKRHQRALGHLKSCGIEIVAESAGIPD